MNREECLKEAYNITNGARDKQYGKPEDCFNRIARLWGAYYGGIVFTPEDVAVFLALLKIARIRNDATKEDSWIDLAGYAACGCECATKGNDGKALSIGENKVTSIGVDQ